MNAQTAPTARVQRLIDATPEEVFVAWTQPELVARWFAPGAMRAVVSSLEARPGGKYRIEMHDDAENKTHTVAGKFIEVKNPHRLVMTWCWENGDGHESLVTVQIAPHKSGTEVTIIHERVKDQASADSHAKGWTGCLENLAQRISTFH